MDSFFNIGGPELLFILLLAGIVMGPQRIRQIAKWLGRVTVQLQAISRGFARQLNAELDAVDEGGELKGAMQEIQELRQQMKDLRKEVIGAASAPLTETELAIRQTQEAMRSIKPPHIGDDSGNGRNEATTPTPLPDNRPQTPTAPPNLPSIVDVPDDPEP